MTAAAMPAPASASASAYAPAYAQSRAMLAFAAGGARFVLPLSGVEAVIRLPPTVPVPLGPAYLVGLARLRGAVLAVVDAALLAGAAASDRTPEARVLVMAAGYGLLVERVEGMRAEDAADRALDLSSLVDPERAVRHAQRTVQAPHTDAGSGDAAEAGEAFLSFTVDGCEYALPLHAVQEVAPMEAGVEGGADALQWRGARLPVASLRRLLGSPDADGGFAATQPARVAVLRLEGLPPLGLLVDRTGEVLRVPAAQCHPVPPLLARGTAGEVASICRLDDGARLVCVLSPERLLGAAATPAPAPPIETPGARAAAGQHAALAGEGDGGPIRRFVAYRLGAQHFAIPILQLDEVLRLDAAVAPVPGDAAPIDGLRNLRGTALPLIDLKRRLGLPAAPRTGGEKILVLTAQGGGGEVARAGFIVDEVLGVRAAGAAIVAPPPGLPGEASTLVSEVLTPPGEPMLLVLDLGALLAWPAPPAGTPVEVGASTALAERAPA